MNLDSASNNQLGQAQQAVERVCNEFEAAWRKDPDHRIEDMLPSIRDIIRPLLYDSNSPNLMRDILGELIHIEMDLRFEVDEEFDQFEYYLRFPDFGTVIDEAIERIKQLASGTAFDSMPLVATASIAGRSKSDHDQDWKIVQKGNTELPSELGPYQQITRIGVGGFGVVCQTIDSRNGQKVALKFPRHKILNDDDLLNLFLEEANRAKDLDHPGIVKTHSVEQIDGYLTIVQQLIIGTDLKKTKKQPRTREEIAELVASVADALAYANRQGIVHRDLKPANILLDENGRPYIADFGLALHESGQLDMPNQRCGTPPYMSPQLVAGLTKNLDGRADIWSLGVILYELLAGRRPFRGNTMGDVFEQIETRDPKPLRQIDHTIDRELERICLKCLARQARDRYLTGDDLAEDLRHWIANPPALAPKDKQAVFIPKGLRSYGAEDSAFFLQLLPGPRDRNDIPASIRFWSVRICEPVAPENRVPVGVIYGPSGSGKSSFVKAGLLPQVKQHVEAVYVESTQSDTEVRLIKALRDRYPDIPIDISLPAIFAGLSVGRWQTSPKKILIILDQFEQRLSVADDYSQSQLARALRHCDGQQLQSLLLVRDDFWLALTRFADALEMDLLEGQNAQDIDLFDREHAKRVLIKLGRAYGRLPDETVELSSEQQAFLNEAIDQLAVGNYVICVRMTLFAEMFKSRPWSMAELKTVGGIRGVGETFLGETFGSESRSRRYKLQADSVQAVLEALLPEEGSDIRGAMKSESELMLASHCEDAPDKFKSLITTLDKELRLITATDPDSSHDAECQSGPITACYNHYQLTHDYLVPAIRGWLYQAMRTTKQGRAQLRFRELAAGWNKNNRQQWLPTVSEFLSILRYVRLSSCNPNEKSYYRRSLNHHLLRTGVISLALTLVMVAFVVYRGIQKKSLAKSHVDLFMKCEPAAIPAAMELLRQNPVFAKSELMRKASMESSRRIRAQLGWLLLEPTDSSMIGDLLNQVHEIDPRECESILTGLAPHGSAATSVIDSCRKINSSNPLSVNRLNILRLFHEPSEVDLLPLDFADVPDCRTGILFELERWHGDTSVYLEMLDATTDPGRLNAILTTVGSIGVTDMDAATRKTIVARVKSIYKEHEHPSVHNSALWALRNWKETIPEIKARVSERWYVNQLGMTMIRVEAGNVIVARGSTKANIKEMEVEVQRPFFVGSEEVLNGQFREFLESQNSDLLMDPEFEDHNPKIKPRVPVTYITLGDMARFCNWLSCEEKLKPCYIFSNEELTPADGVFEALPAEQAWILNSEANGYRLPTYAEWELAASGGASTNYYFASENFSGHLGKFAWYSGNSFFNGKLQKQPCGKKLPNPFGLFDVLGNVSEICWDSPFEKIQLDHTVDRFARGGCFEFAVQGCTTSSRVMRRVHIPIPEVGFRVVRTAK